MNKIKINAEKDYEKKLKYMKPILTSFALKKIRNYSDSQDVVQDCLIILFKKKSSFDSSKSFFSWAFTILNFQIKAFFSRGRRLREDSCEEIEKATPNAHSNYVNIRNFIENRKDQLFKLNLSKDCLSARESQVLNLTLKGFKQVEISKELNIKPCHVSVYNKNIITKIRSKLNDS